jgi:hypothetical protein
VARNLADALREVDLKVTVVNTEGSFGPGGSGSLPLPLQMEWAKSYDITMPQWYGPMRFYGPYFHDELEKGDAAKVYGRQNGYADVIPLLNVSMGYGLEDPAALRFKLFDFLSTSPAIKGVGYYIASNAFTDAKFMAGLSRVHTLLADVEDYYVDGRRPENIATFTPTTAKPAPIPGMDSDGQETMIDPEVKTTVRVHQLNRAGRLALITIVSHSNQAVGQAGRLRLDLKALGIGGKGYALFDVLSDSKAPLRTLKPNESLVEVPVNTGATNNLALLEIRTVK